MIVMTEWVKLFKSSKDPEVRQRTAKLILTRGEQAPLPVIIEILESFYNTGLGATTENLLLRRRDKELFDVMVIRLDGPAPWVRAVACKVLGRVGGAAAREHLLRKLDDPMMLVRRAAGVGLGWSRDQDAIPELLTRYEEVRTAEDHFLRLPLEEALDGLGAIYDKVPRKGRSDEIPSGS